MRKEKEVIIVKVKKREERTSLFITLDGCRISFEANDLADELGVTDTDLFEIDIKRTMSHVSLMIFIPCIFRANCHH